MGSDKLAMKVLLLIQILVVISFQDLAESAAACDVSQTCLPLTDCPAVMNKVSDRKVFQTNVMLRQYLKSITCGWDGKDSKVCCDEVEIDERGGELRVEETIKCGIRTGATNTLISGGEDATPGDWPWMVLLQNSNKNLICGGALLTSKHVVTAAHCLSSSLTSVVLGEHDLSTEYDCFFPEDGCEGPKCVDDEDCAPKHQVYQIQNFTKHPRYKELGESHSEFDIALLTLKKRVKFSDFVSPICLPSLEPESLGKTRPLKVLGWGNTLPGFEKQHADRLQQLNVREVMIWNCDLKFKKFSKTDFKTSHMCTTSDINGASACKGDSGGPLVREMDDEGQAFELAGVQSFGGTICGNIDLPNVFTRIDGQVNYWLHDQIDSYYLPVRP